MLNKNLRDEVLIEIIGKILYKQKLFQKNFDTKLLSEIIFMLKQFNFSLDDHIIEEGDEYDKF